MPAAKQVAPGSLNTQIRMHLLDHPGAHRPRDIAAALPRPEGFDRSKWTMRVANVCAQLSKPARGRNAYLERVEKDADNPFTRYRLAPPAPTD